MDSRQIETGDALDKGFRDAAAPEIDQFKRDYAARHGAGSVADSINESELLREVMNTVGRPGRLGEQIRCVVSVSMLTERWDTNAVTHILGVCAFGTQLPCEEVVGRRLRRQSYDLNTESVLFDDVGNWARCCSMTRTRRRRPHCVRESSLRATLTCVRAIVLRRVLPDPCPSPR